MELNNETIDIFRYDVNKFQKIDAEMEYIKRKMKPLQLRLKDLKYEKSEIEQLICKTMNKNNLVRAELPNEGGLLEYNVSLAVAPMTQVKIKEKFEDFFENGPGSQISFNSYKGHEKANLLYNFIYSKENRERKEKEKLKRLL